MLGRRLLRSVRRVGGSVLRCHVTINFLSCFLVFFVTAVVVFDVIRHQGGLRMNVRVDHMTSQTEETGDLLGCMHRYSYQRHVNMHAERMTSVHSSLRAQEGQVCKHPVLDPCHPKVMQFDRNPYPINCTVEEDWVYVDNGTFRISAKARQKHGKILCEYAPLVRGKDDYSARHAEHIKPMLDGSPLASDFFKVACMSPSGRRYHSIHAGVTYNATLHERSKQVPMPSHAMGYDVFMFGFDSISRVSILRNLPKTRDYFVNKLGGLELEGYNILGDGTVQALLPILTGKSEADLPSARRGVPGSVNVDDFPWIWDDFRRAGYVTAWGEDMSYIGTFQMRLNGFKRQPVDHSMRTYFLLAEPMYKRFEPYCVGSVPRHKRFTGWFRDLFSMYGNKPKFMFGFHSELSHGNNNDLKAIDDDMVSFFKDLHTSGYLDRTILIFMSDHGARFSDLRRTPQGKLEERMPMFSMRFPESFISKYPKVVENFKLNRYRLTTPFDVHETFHDILNFTGATKGSTINRGISLFKEIPKDRSCTDAGLDAHWCACLDWEDVSGVSEQAVVGQFVINYLNEMTLPVRDQCAELFLTKILTVHRYYPNSQVLKFKQSSDIHGDIPDLSDNMTLDYDYYRVTLETTPGQGLFEVTLTHSLMHDTFRIEERDISRISEYGTNPRCIENSFPNLRIVCYCL